MTITKLITSARLVLVLATAGLAAAACSSSSKHTGDVDTAFVAKANAICATAVAKHGGAKLPVANFDPLHPDPGDLPAIGQYFARYGGATTTAAQLDALDAPRKHQGDWTKLRALVDEVATNARLQISAAEQSDIPAFEKTVHKARTLANRIDGIGPKLGFTDSSPCRKVFG